MPKLDVLMLSAALALGVAAALRRFGIGSVSLPAAALLAGAAALSLAPLVRLFGGREASGGGEASGVPGGAAEAAYEAEPPAARRRAIVAVIFGVHLVATLFFFPPEDILNDRPVLTLDHSLHYIQVVRAKEVFGRSLRLHSYNPVFMAGYPGGTVFDIDSKGVELWCSLARMVDTARAFKIFILCAHLLLPFTIYAACRRLRYGFEETIFALLLLLALWHWGRPYVGHFRFAGMFSYLFVCHLSLYVSGLFRAFLDGEPVRRFYVIGPLAFFVHPTAAVLLPVPFAALLFARRRWISEGITHGAWLASRAAPFALWCAIVLAANAVWLVPLLRNIGVKTSSQAFFQIAGLRGLFDVLVKPGNLPALALCLLAAIGLVRLARERRWDALAAPAAGGLFLLCIASYGIYLPGVDQLEPGRFLVPALIFLAPLSGAGAAVLVGAARAALPSPRLSRAVPAAVSIALLISAPALSLASSRSFFRHTLGTTFAPAARELIEALESRLDPSGRLMIEDGPAWAYGNTFLPALLPSYTGVEQIGGPYPHTFIEHHFASFTTCRAFGRDLAEMDPARFREYLDLYNVHWILTATPECSARIEGLGCGSVVWSSGAFTLREVSGESTFASPPGAAVRALAGEIGVTIPCGGGPIPDRILLKYHWDPGLKADPPARIHPERRLDDPVPFIVLEPRGANEVIIRYRR